MTDGKGGSCGCRDEAIQRGKVGGEVEVGAQV